MGRLLGVPQTADRRPQFAGRRPQAAGRSDSDAAFRRDGLKLTTSLRKTLSS